MTKPEAIGKILNQTEIGRELQREKNRQKKQLVGVVKKKRQIAPVEQNVMEFSSVFATTPEDRKRGWLKIGLKNGKYAEIRAVIPQDRKQPDLIQEGDLDILLVCFLLAKHRKSYTFEASSYQILGELGEKTTTGGNQYKRVRGALSRLKSNLITTNWWWDTLRKERIIRSQFNFLDKVDEGEERTFRISLNKGMMESIERGYRKNIKLEKVFRLRGYGKLLCLYLMKRIGIKKEFEHNLDTILKLLGLEKKWGKLPKFRLNFYVERTIIPAMERASETIGFHCEYKREEKKFYLHKPFSIAHKQK